MAKKKSFGENSDQPSTDRGSMARVVISKKLSDNTYAFKEAMVRESNVKDYINKNKA